MNPLKQVSIEELSTTYTVDYTYHSDQLNKDYDATVIGIAEQDGTITINPTEGSSFKFSHSDPDRVIALASMFLSFARMVKNESSINTEEVTIEQG